MGAVHVDGSSSEKLVAWLSKGHRGEGAGEELDWLVGQAREWLVATGNGARLGEIAGQLAEWAGDSDEDRLAASALLHACQLAEDAGDAEAACDYAERAMTRYPSDPAAMIRLDRLLSKSGDLARLEAARTSQVELLSERAPLEHAMRVEALRALAVLRAEALHDLDSAIDAYQQSIEIEPIDSTMEALAELYLRRDHAGDSDEAAELYFQLAERADPEGARPLLEQALDVQPDHEGALQALQQLSELSGEDDPRLVSRMVAFASVAPASPQRDSVIEELKRRNSDVTELETALGESRAPESESEHSVGADALAPTIPGAPAAPSSLAAALQAHGEGDSPVTSTLSYASAASPRPEAGLARAAGASGAATEQANPGGTLPFHAQTPGSSSASATPGRVYESVAPGRPPSRWLRWSGGVALLLLIAWALLAIGDGPSEPKVEPASGVAAADPASSAPPSSEAPGQQANPTGSDQVAPSKLRAEREQKQARARRAPKPSKSSKPSRAQAAAPKARVIGGVALPPAMLRVQGGSLDARALYARLEPTQRALARCYRSLRRRAPRARGLIEYGWTIGPRGGALEVRDVSGSLDARTVRLCGIRALRAARFPHPKGGAATVRAVFDFAPPRR